MQKRSENLRSAVFFEYCVMNGIRISTIDKPPNFWHGYLMERLLFKNRYRIPSARLRYWDYTQSGHYFITIKTQHNLPYFGVIRNRIMGLSEIGLIAADELLKIPIIRPYVGMDEWAVMPNHIHVILYIKLRPAVETPSEGVSTDC